MTMLHSWAAHWGVSLEAVADLQQRIGLTAHVSQHEAAGGEAAASVEVCLDAAQHGVSVWRNNVGALQDVTGRWVRYGLANDSKAMNEAFKSGDFIGCKPVTITPQMIGWRIGQFVSREVKHPGWTYKATEREQAQLKWAELVMSLGGDAQFATGRGSF